MENSRAQITLPNGDLIVGVKEVDEYIIELLGVDVNQFSQIALLAQGEFLKLLNSSTQERSQIFRSIFKTNDYQILQLKLKDEMLNLKNDYEKLKDSILQYISQLDIEDEEIVEIKNKYIQTSVFDDLSYFIEKIEKQNKADFLILEANDKKIKLLNDEYLKLNKIFEAVKIKNSLLDKKDELQKLNLIYQSEFEAAKKDYDLIDEKNKLQIKLQNELAVLNEEYKKITKLSELNIKINQLKNKLEASLSAFDALKFHQTKVKYFSVFNLKRKLKNLQNEFKLLDTEVKTQTHEYENAYHHYLSSQAGILAKDLKENFPCPVCGSKIHPNPAGLSDEMCDVKSLDELKLIIENKKNALNQKSNECALLIKDIKIEEESLDDFIEKYEIKVEFNKLDEEIFNSKILNLHSKENEFEKINLEIASLNTDLAALNAQYDAFLNDVKITNTDEFLKIHKDKTDAYNALSLEIKQIRHNYDNKNLLKEQNLSQLNLINKQLQDYQNVNVEEFDKLNLQILDLENEISLLRQNTDKTSFVYSLNMKLIDNIKSKYKEFCVVNDKYSHYKILSDCANGNLKGKPRIAFEQYIQGYYLDMVLFEANKRFSVMTKNQYRLQRKKDASNILSKTGLEIEVMDFHTFKTRSTKTLSGGESFKAALCLALGLSDCISMMSGALNIDMIFIDEGFGTLDFESLDLAMDVILDLSQTNKLVGIISHVEELKSKIENQILSIKTPHGSNMKFKF